MEFILTILNFVTTFLGRIFFAFGRLFITPTVPLPQPKQPEILNLSATILAEKIRTKQLTSEQVVSAFIERCEQVNERLNAIIEDRFEAALEEAKNTDRIIQNTTKTIEELKRDTPLLGVPITVKECCMVKGLSYTCGTKLRKDIKASEDGEAVARLRKAGAIPIAVTNVPELVCSVETRNNIIGYTSNPYNTNYTAGGSSGGEGSLISSGGSVLGLGSDFAGSIRIPSLYNGLFGHRPTSGIIPSKGHFPDNSCEHYQKLFTVGPICRYADDLKLSLEILSGANANLLKLDKKVDFKKLKIYYPRDKGLSLFVLPVDESIQVSIQKAVEHFQTVRRCVTQKIYINEPYEFQIMWYTQCLEIEGIEKMLCLKEPEAECSLTRELLNCIMKKSDYSMEVLLLRLALQAGFYLLSENKKSEYASARRNFIERLEKILQDDGVLFFPTFATSAHYKNQSFWTFNAAGYPIIANVLGFPATHVTMGLNKDGLPTGFQVIAAPYQDRLCLAVAEELEKIFGGWVPPSL